MSENNYSTNEAYLKRKAELDAIREERRRRYASNQPEKKHISSQPEKIYSSTQQEKRYSSNQQEKRVTRQSKAFVEKRETSSINRDLKSNNRQGQYNYTRDIKTVNKNDVWYDVKEVKKTKQKEKQKFLSLKKAIAIALVSGIPLAGISGILSYEYVSNSPEIQANIERQENVNKKIFNDLNNLSYGKNNPDYATTTTESTTNEIELGDEK